MSSASLLHRRVSARFDDGGADGDADGDDALSLRVAARIDGERGGFHRRLVVAVDASSRQPTREFDFDVVGVRVVVPREAFVDVDELRELSSSSTGGWECAAIGDVDVEAPARRAGEATLTCARASSSSSSSSSWTLDVPVHARYGLAKLGGGKSRVEFAAPVRATALTTDGRWVDGVQSATALESSLGWDVPVGDAGSADAVRWITDGTRVIGAVIVFVFALRKRMRRGDGGMKRVKNN
jgi:hypothetical protein